jgi:hypothetical protein
MTASVGYAHSGFLLLRGHCFSIIKTDAGHPTYCDEPVVWKGPWRDANGEVWIVEACGLHMPHQGHRPTYRSVL